MTAQPLRGSGRSARQPSPLRPRRHKLSQPLLPTAARIGRIGPELPHVAAPLPSVRWRPTLDQEDAAAPCAQMQRTSAPSRCWRRKHHSSQVPRPRLAQPSPPGGARRAAQSRCAARPPKRLLAAGRPTSTDATGRQPQPRLPRQSSPQRRRRPSGGDAPGVPPQPPPLSRHCPPPAPRRGQSRTPAAGWCCSCSGRTTATPPDAREIPHHYCA
mmetsp:Transcript_43742/g.126366  ORF Transcript_43742/g.126366 Transcript_43742/m.126366 type:complete len:214 (+) Transcript_43742:401-1042(+)